MKCKGLLVGGSQVSKFFLAIPLQWFERETFGLSFAYSLHAALFLISSQMATDLLENFHMFLTKIRFFFWAKSFMWHTKEALQKYEK